jgi:cyanophycin synthetase
MNSFEFSKRNWAFNFMRIISTTGTKGKTTVTRILAFVLHELGEKTLRVDNEGHYINEKQQSTREDSLNLFRGKTPNVCPGRYLITMKNKFPNFTAILEASIGCGGEGLGYGFHNIGIFTNIFEDHIQKNTYLSTKADLAQEKSFIIKRVENGGSLIFNADDKYVCSQLKKIFIRKNIKLVPVGFAFKHFPIERHLKNGGVAITKNENFVILKSQSADAPIVDYEKLNWTFKGKHTPSIFNLMLSLGALWAYDKKKFHESAAILSKYVPVKQGGRLAVFKNSKGPTIILDYAHEKHSLKELAFLGNKLKTRKLIGVLRLGKSSSNELISDVSKAVSKSFDHFIIYDKIDGVSVKKYKRERLSDLVRKKGEISKIFTQNLAHLTKNPVERIVQEEKAIKRASQIAKKGDVVAIIWNTDPQKTASYIKKYFTAI